MSINETGLNKQEIEDIQSTYEQFQLNRRTDDQIRALIRELNESALELYAKACDEEELAENVQKYLDRKIPEEDISEET